MEGVLPRQRARLVIDHDRQRARFPEIVRLETHYESTFPPRPLLAACPFPRPVAFPPGWHPRRHGTLLPTARGHAFPTPRRAACREACRPPRSVPRRPRARRPFHRTQECG